MCLRSLIKTIYWWRIPSPPKKWQSQLCVYSPTTFYPKTVLGPVPYPMSPVPDYDMGKVQKLESQELYPFPVPMLI